MPPGLVRLVAGGLVTPIETSAMKAFLAHLVGR
jgi:hypothetical protein